MAAESILVPLTELVHHLKVQAYIIPYKKSHFVNLPHRNTSKGAATAVAMH